MTILNGKDLGVVGCQRGTLVADVLCFAGEAVPNTSPPVDSLKDAGYDFDFCGTDLLYQLTVKDGQVGSAVYGCRSQNGFCSENCN